VLAGHQAAFYGDDIASHTLTGAGASATDLTFGPRLGGGCQAIGLYHWQLVIPTQLVLTHANNDSCPRAQGLGAAPLDLVSRSTAPIS
jgi:hypothetical protein